jgi:phenylalanyl-tRNA synthetase beta subunit
MRTSMVPSMLNMLAYNLNRGSDNVRLFESGNVFEASGAEAMPLELKRISVSARRATWMRKWCADWFQERRRVRSRSST